MTTSFLKQDVAGQLQLGQVTLGDGLEGRWLSTQISSPAGMAERPSSMLDLLLTLESMYPKVNLKSGEAGQMLGPHRLKRKSTPEST